MSIFVSVWISTIFTPVFSLPIPVNDKSAATLMLAGNKETASFAVPSKIVVGESIASKSILEFSKNLAPLRERGCFGRSNRQRF